MEPEESGAAGGSCTDCQAEKQQTALQQMSGFYLCKHFHSANPSAGGAEMVVKVVRLVSVVIGPDNI